MDFTRRHSRHCAGWETRSRDNGFKPPPIGLVVIGTPNSNCSPGVVGDKHLEDFRDKFCSRCRFAVVLRVLYASNLQWTLPPSLCARTNLIGTQSRHTKGRGPWE